MSDFLKINTNGQILDTTFDGTEANKLDAPRSKFRAGGQDYGAREFQPRTICSSRRHHIPDPLVECWEGVYFYTINQNISTDQ